MKITDIAAICHEANRRLCLTHGDTSQPAWEIAPDWQRESAIDGVRFHLGRLTIVPSNSHENWFRMKEADGWKYGPVKDPEKKEHPCMVPFHALPDEQKAKDYLFSHIVFALKPFTLGDEEPD